MDPITRLTTIGAAGAGGASGYWIATIGGTVDNDYGFGITLDSAQNVYIAGQISYQFNTIKYDSLGALQWQKALTGTNIESARGIAVGSLGDIYVAGFTDFPGTYSALIAKYNSSGALQWQRTLTGASSEQAYSLALDSSDNIYIAGYSLSVGAGQTDTLVAKYNSSGVIQWQRTLGGISSDPSEDVAVDSSGNVYIMSRTISTGAGSYDFVIAKYNSSGAIQWQRLLGGTGAEYAYGIALDGSANIYVVGRTRSAGAGSYDGLIAKYSSSGVIQWQRTLGGTGSDSFYGVAADSSGNAYVIGVTSSTGAGATEILIAKYDSSGAIQWQRTLGGTSSEDGRRITVDNLGNIYIIGATGSTVPSSFDVLIAKLPDDGSLTGTYGSLIYASSSLTDAAASLTDAASSLTDSASSLTDAASSLTDSATSYTSSTITL